MADYPWYEIRSHKAKIAQGDIIFDLIVPAPQYDETSVYHIKTAYKKRSVILMTQACDLEQEKVEHVKVCGIIPLNDYLIGQLIADEINSRKQRAANSKSEIDKSPIKFDYESKKIKDKINKMIQQLRTGHFLDLYLLNQELGEEKMDAYIVNLREEYTLPLKSLQAHIKLGNTNRLSLNPPYREHLNQAFVNLYSRIGLPQDIKFEEINLNLKKEFEYPE
ncbi:MAG: hypothetical protein ABS948_11940 [Solibacillus sp.]